MRNSTREFTRRCAATAQGGSDILMSMHSSGELAQSLQKLKQRGETTS
jgi:hypothetical protein